MSAGDGFFVDSNVLLYSVDPVDSASPVRVHPWLKVQYGRIANLPYPGLG